MEPCRVCGAAGSGWTAKEGSPLTVVEPLGVAPGTGWHPLPHAPAPAAARRIIRCILKHIAHHAFLDRSSPPAFAADGTREAFREPDAGPRPTLSIARPIRPCGYSPALAIKISGNNRRGFAVFFRKGIVSERLQRCAFVVAVRSRYPPIRGGGAV